MQRRSHQPDEQIDRSMRTERTFAMSSSTFGILALVLSAVGLYGVIANAVSRRRRELSIRLALGAEPRRIVRLVLGEAGLLVALGAVVGLPGALLTARAIRSPLFDIQSGDWKSVAAALGVLMTVATFTAWVPARRASRELLPARSMASTLLRAFPQAFVWQGPQLDFGTRTLRAGSVYA
jgi:putative ABC transport system permease protein